MIYDSMDTRMNYKDLTAMSLEQWLIGVTIPRFKVTLFQVDEFLQLMQRCTTESNFIVYMFFMYLYWCKYGKTTHDNT